MTTNKPTNRIKIGIYTTISPEYLKLAKDYKIKRSEALAVGMSVLLAEKGLRDYDNRLIIVRRFNMYKEDLEKKNKEITDLLNKINELKIIRQ